MEVNVDLIGGGQAQGLVANQIANNGSLNIGKMRPYIDQNGRACATFYMGGDPKKKESYKTVVLNTNATLRRDEWKTLDDAILEVSRQRLGGIEDLNASNLTYNLGNAMGTTVLEWHDISDSLEAELTMDGITRSKNDKTVFQHNYLPIPIIHVDYEINARVLAASRNMGNPLDTTSAERAARRVLEKLEAMLFTNTTYAFGEKDSRTRNSIYSYINHPDRNSVTMSTPWSSLKFASDAAKGGQTIVGQVLEMKQASLTALHYGPWMLYVPTAYETLLDQDYDDQSNGVTIRDRILKIGGIKGVKVVDYLPTNNVLLVQMTSDVVRLVKGLGIQNVEWSSQGNMVTNYKVMTIQVPQIRSDQNGKSGIVHLA